VALLIVLAALTFGALYVTRPVHPPRSATTADPREVPLPPLLPPQAPEAPPPLEVAQAPTAAAASAPTASGKALATPAAPPKAPSALEWDGPDVRPNAARKNPQPKVTEAW
jgi:hypothetical protein